MDLKKYKKYEPIYVIGHINIDLDSAVSSKILCDILNYNGIKSYYAVLDSKYDFDLTNKKMLNDCLDFKPKVIKASEIKKYNYILVDHNDPLQSVCNEKNVIAAIDHHPNSFKIKDTTISNICSTALFLYNEFKNDYCFSEEEKYQIFLAFVSDSAFGKSSKCRKEDIIIAKELNFEIDFNKLFKKYFETTDLSNGVSIGLTNGLKTFQFNNICFDSGRIEVFGTNGLKEYEKLIYKQNSFLGIWKDYENEKTYVFFKYDNLFKKFKYNFIASRATTILDDVIKYLKECNYLKEND